MYYFVMDMFYKIPNGVVFGNNTSYNYDTSKHHKEPYMDSIEELRSRLGSLCKRKSYRVLQYGIQEDYIINESTSFSIATQTHNNKTIYVVVYNYNESIINIITMNELSTLNPKDHKSARTVIQ